MPSKKLWAYIAKLEKLIKETIETSPEISELVEKIQREGVEVSLNCIALFSDRDGRSFVSPDATAPGLEPEKPAPARKRRRKKPGTTPPAGGKKKPGSSPRKGKPKEKPEFKVTEADKEFLRQIGIRFD